MSQGYFFNYHSLFAAQMVDFLKEKHIQYIAELDNRRNDLAYWQTEHLRISGIYWGLTALDLLGSLESLNKEQVIKFVVDCQQQDGTTTLLPQISLKHFDGNRRVWRTS